MATLYVWLPRYSGPQKGNVGHASLELDRNPPDYISWWPSGAASLTDPATASFERSSYQQDVGAEGAPPDHRLSITCLDEAAMGGWWQRVSFDGRATPYRDQFWPKTSHYHLYHTNCANVVALAMRIGGAEQFAPMPSPLLVMTPKDVLSWGNRINVAAKQ